MWNVLHPSAWSISSYVRATCMYICACACTQIYMYMGIHKRKRAYICMYSRRSSSRRKSRCEIIMQKMHREDYDLICRESSSKFERRVPRKPSKLPSMARLCLRSVFYYLKQEWNDERRKRNAYVLTGCERRVYISG